MTVENKAFSPSLKKHKGLNKNYEPYISKYMARNLKYMPYIFCLSTLLFFNIIEKSSFLP